MCIHMREVCSRDMWMRRIMKEKKAQEIRTRNRSMTDTLMNTRNAHANQKEEHDGQTKPNQQCRCPEKGFQLIEQKIEARREEKSAD